MISDWNNALKAGFDAELLRWPAWLLESELGRRLGHCLPKVMELSGPVFLTNVSFMGS